MPCKTVREQLHTLSDGERLIHWRETAAVVSRCLRCSDCRTFFWQLQRLRHTTRHLPLTLAVRATLRGRVLAQLPIALASYETVLASQERDEARRRRQEKIRRRAALVVVIGFSFVGGYGIQNPGKILAILHDQTEDDPQQAVLFLKRTQELREAWKPWAMKHRADLTLMLKNQRATYHRVQSALPKELTQTKETVLTYEDLDAPGLPFAYLHLLHDPNGKSNLIRNTYIQGARVSTSIPDPTIEKYLDFELLCSMKMGRHYSLWVSGRITEKIETTEIGRPYVVSREIAPPYEELTR